jgi:PhoH-like ATPase
MTKKIYVFDTSVCLTDFNSIRSYEDNDVVLPLKVLDEIDDQKKRQDGVGTNARSIIRLLDSYRESGSLYEGIRIEENKGLIYVKNYDPTILPKDLDPTCPDNQIIATALTERTNSPDREVIMVSRDINMRVKCDALGLACEDYNVDQVVKTKEELYTGFTEHLVDDQIVDRFYAGEDVYIDEETGEKKFYPNQFIMLISNSNQKKTALAKFENYIAPLRKLKENRSVWSLKSKNKEQNFAFELLMDPAIPIVSLIGKAGSGKTLLAVAAGLQQVVDDNVYKKIIVSRPIQPMGKDIGFLPGTLEEKMDPWLAPIQDNLEFLLGNDKMTLLEHVQRGLIEIEALTYIRGRSISNAYIVIDEAQNLTSHEIKTILTRVGENTKIILTGDIEQIDNIYIDGTTNGLAYAVEKLKDYDLAGHIFLRKGERSKVATLAADIL